MVLSACGGGGGSEPEPQPPAPPVNAAPIASFSVSAAEGYAPLTVTFDGAESRDPDGRITTYAWAFGDDATATGGPGISHVFTDTGAFDVQLTVTDDAGRTAMTSQTLRVRGTTVSGTVHIAAGSSVDSDVNDRLTEPVANDTFAEAQAVANPLRLGGFVNVPGSGSAAGNFGTTGDPADVYFVELQGDERIILSIGDPGADLDLELYSDAANPELLDASISANPTEDATEDLRAPASPGHYYLRVSAVAGASSYVLSIDDGALLPHPQARRRAKRLSDAFAPGEVLMARRSDPAVQRFRINQVRGGRQLRLARTDGPLVTTPALEFGDFALPAEASISPAMRIRYRTLLAARAANAEGDVDAAEVNVLHQSMRVPNDPFFPQQWNLRAIQLEDAWEITTGQGRDVVVAVVDTGLVLRHPDLRNRLLRDAGNRIVGYDFIQSMSRANDGDGPDDDPADPGDDAMGLDRGSFHGTHVAGVLAAETDNGLGVAGVNWGARIMPLRVLGVDGGTTFDVMQAVRFAAGLSNSSGRVLPPEQRADIINLSLGSTFYSEFEQRSFTEARARGVFIVSSAGNDRSSVPSYPASYDGVISVTASTIDGRTAPYANFGPQIDLAAPGGLFGTDRDGDGAPDAVISSTAQGGGADITTGFDYLQGTSMAAPHVAGVIALMLSINSRITPNGFDAMLAAGRLTDDAGAPGRDERFGWGIINAYKAVNAALGSRDESIGPVLSVSSDRLDFQSFTQALDFSVDNLGSTPTRVTVTADRPWLAVVETDAAANGFGAYVAEVDRTQLADGRYGATITIVADDPRVPAHTIAVTAEVTSPDLAADAGQHYVVLVDVDGSRSESLQVVNAVNGEYAFRLEDVPPGEYRLFAGTDLDDDDVICDGTEACGAYPSLTNPAIILVNPSEEPEIDERSFPSEFRTTATATGLGAQSGIPAEDAGLRLQRTTGRVADDD